MSTLRVNSLQDASGGSTSSTNAISQGRAKVWASFDGTGTVSLHDSFNVSALTDTGSGRYKLTFSNAMSNNNFAAVSNQRLDTNGGAPNIVHTGIERDDCTTTTCGIRCGTGNQNAAASSGSFGDVSSVMVAIFGDQ